MTTLLTDLMQHLQTLHTDHPDDDGRLMVAVPTAAHTMEHFEVSEFHHDGPSVVLYCQPPEPEKPMAAPTAEPEQRALRRSRTCAHNDYNDLC
jgi:hypothetical protein